MEQNSNVSLFDEIKKLLKQNGGSVTFDEPGGVFLQYDYSDGFDGGYWGEEYAVYTNEIYLKDERIYAKCGKDDAESEEEIQSFTEKYRVNSRNLKNIEDDVYYSLVKSPGYELNYDLCYAIAKSPYVPAKILGEILSKHKDFRIRWYVARNPNTPVESLKTLAKDEDSVVRICVAKNPNTPVESLKTLAKDEDSVVRMCVAKNPNTPVNILEALLKDESYDVCEGVARNPTFNGFLQDINNSLKEADPSVSRQLTYYSYEGTIQLRLRYKINDTSFTRKVDFDFEKSVMNIYDTKNEKKIVGKFDWEKKELIVLRKGPKNDIKKKI